MVSIKIKPANAFWNAKMATMDNYPLWSAKNAPSLAAPAGLMKPVNAKPVSKVIYYSIINA